MRVRWYSNVIYRKYEHITFVKNQRMKLSINIFILTLLFSISFSVFAQDVPKCRTYDAIDILLLKYPHLRDQMHEAEEDLEIHTREFIENKALRGGDDEEVYIIPVVFHIIHDGGEENISNDQVYDAMKILNRDFRLQNEDVADVVDEFQDLPADIKIEFRLAQLDPNGNCTSGIVRVQSPLTDEGGESMKNLSRWSRDSYMNVWICREAGGAAGYTFTPATVAGNFGLQNDGIVLLHNYTGSIGTSTVTNSRALTHEVGHWINLRHPWGPTNDPGLVSNCSVDDGVTDTPRTVGWTSCNLNGESCGSLDNVQNYMDYSYCSRMFTHGQKDRMRAAITALTAQRFALWQPGNLEETGVLDAPSICFADFTSDRISTCSFTEITFDDQSYNSPSHWRWDFGDGTILEGENLSEPVHMYSEPGEYTVQLTVSTSENEATVTKENYISVASSDFIDVPFAEGFETLENNLNEELKWTAIGEPATQEWTLSDQAAFAGNQSVKLRNGINPVDDIDNLVSAAIDFSGDTEIMISYRWAFAKKEVETDDRLRIQISNDCGATWQQRKLHRGFGDLATAPNTNDEFVPSDESEWSERDTIIITESEYFNPSFKLRFSFQNFGGNDIYLDDINITSSDIVSTEDIEQQFAGLSLYPNPTSSESILDLSVLSSKENTDIFVVNATGKRVLDIYNGQLNEGSHQFTISSRSLAPGMYFIALEDKHSSRREKWILFE